MKEVQIIISNWAIGGIISFIHLIYQTMIIWFNCNTSILSFVKVVKVVKVGGSGYVR